MKTGPQIPSWGGVSEKLPSLVCTAAFCFLSDCAFTNLSGAAEVLPSEIFSAHADLCVYLCTVLDFLGEAGIVFQS